MTAPNNPVWASRIKSMTLAGHTAPEIAEALSISTRTVQRYRVATGCARPVATKLTAEQLALAQSLLDDGCSVKEVSRTLGCGHYTIVRHFPGRGWPHERCGAFTEYAKQMERLGRTAGQVMTSP